MFSRRGFIAALAAFTSGAILDPEKLLWVPGAKTISIPPRPRISASTIAALRAQREYLNAGFVDVLMFKREAFVIPQGIRAIGSTRPVRVPVQPITVSGR